MNELIKKTLEIPVCRTYHGCMEHVAHSSLLQRSQLAYHLKLRADWTPHDLARALWKQKNKK